MFGLTFLVLLLLLSLSAYPQEEEADNCIMKELCHDDDRANTLVLISQKFPVVFCSGTIISPSYVLTAAHCSSRKPLYIYPGLAFKLTALLKGEANGSRVVEQHLHPQFNRKTLDNDIAIFEVFPQFTLDSAYNGVVFYAWLPDSAIGDRGDPHQWENCKKDSYVMGWSSSFVNTTMDIALCIRAPIMSLEDCQSIFHEVDLKNRICVRQRHGACLNSGGAVICNGEQVAVISYVHCEIGGLPCSRDKAMPKAEVSGAINVALRALGEIGKNVLDMITSNLMSHAIEWLEEHNDTYWKICNWWRFSTCTFHKRIKVALWLLRSDAAVPTKPYVSVRTDTAVIFINDVIDGRAAAESVHRLDMLLLIICIIFVMKKVQ